MSYGATLDQQHFAFLRQACGCGQSRLLGTLEAPLYHHVCRNNAVSSGDIDTVKLVFNRIGHEDYVSLANTADMNVAYCDALLALGVWRRGYVVTFSLNSIPMLKWLLDHDMINVNVQLSCIASDAIERGGQYFDVLHYLIDEMHYTVDKDLLTCIKWKEDVDLSVVDYLISHGADVNAYVSNDGQQSDQQLIGTAPLFLRYWLDKGFIFSLKSFVKNMKSQYKFDFGLLPCMMDILHIDFDTRDDNGMTMIDIANDIGEHDIVEHVHKLRTVQ